MTPLGRLEPGREIQNEGGKCTLGAYCICLLVLLWLTPAFCLTTYGFGGDEMLVRIFISHPGQIQEVKDMGIQLWSEIEGEMPIDVIASQHQLDELIRRGFEIQVLLTAEEWAALEVSLGPEYHTYQEMLNELLALQSAYPEIAMLESVGVSTQERRIIWAFKISDNVQQEEDEPAVLYNGVHHACEVMGLEICMRLINDLLNNYGTDANVTRWVDSTEIWFIPIVNPDGHSVVTDSISLYWRKNGRDLNGNGILYEFECNDSWACTTEGVDVNRNYDFNWETGGSQNPWDFDYRGAYPFSEDESRAIRDLAAQQKFVTSISYHSSGEVVMYPWVWSDGTTAPDESTLTQIAKQMALRMTRQDGVSPYDYTRAWALVGHTTNWFYGTQGTFDFMVETLEGQATPPIPPGSEIDSVYTSLKPGALYILDRVRETSIIGIVSDSLTGQPLKAQVKIAELYSPRVSPRTSDPLFGRYRWLLVPGVYDIDFSKGGYCTKTFPNVSVRTGRTTVLDVQLVPYSHQTPTLMPSGLMLLAILLLVSAICALTFAGRKRRSVTPYG